MERARDESFEVLAEVCGWDWDKDKMTKPERDRVNEALAQLRGVYQDDVTLPQKIREHASAWKYVFPEGVLTPQSITKTWSSIIGQADEKLTREYAQQKEREDANRRVANAPSTTLGCICGGDHMVIVGTRDGHDLAAPCPECGTDNASYYVQGKLIRVMDKGEVREMMSR